MTAAIALTLHLHLLLATPGSWTVGASPACDFASLAAAVRAARPGDLILVEPGSYGPVVVDRGLVIASAAGDTAPFTLLQEPGAPALTVTGIPAGNSVTIRGVRVQYSDARTAAVLASDCAGSVQLHGLQVLTAASAAGAAEAAVVATRCSSLWLRGVRAGEPGVLLDPADPTTGVAALALGDGCDALIQECTLRGFDRSIAGRVAGDGLRVHGLSRAALQDTVLMGGDGGDFGGTALVLVDAPRSRASFCGSCRQTAGLGRIAGGAAVRPASPLPGACLFETAGSVLTPTRWQTGSTALVAIQSFLPRRAWLVLGSPLYRAAGLSGTFGAIAFDPATATLVGSVQLASGWTASAALPCAVPPGREFVGLTLAVQALLDGVPEVPIPAWSTPALVTILG